MSSSEQGGAGGSSAPDSAQNRTAGLPPSESAEQVAERLRRRYPRSRVPRPILVALIGAGTALALWWLFATALHHALPTAAARVSAFTVRSDTRIALTMTVDRPDPTVPVTCRLVAQAPDFQIVGEQAVQVPGGTIRLVNIDVELVTLRRATTAVVKGCTAD